MGFERSMDFIGSQHGVLSETPPMPEMDRFGGDRRPTDIFVPARNMLHEGVFGVGYVPILCFELFGHFG